MDRKSLPSLKSLNSAKSEKLLSTRPHTTVKHTVSQVFGESATTLTRSVPTWSFSKAIRFQYKKNWTSDVPLLELGSTLGKRATSQGYGTRTQYKSPDTPAPDTYELKSTLTSCRSPRIMKAIKETVGRDTWKYDKEIPGPGKYYSNKGFLAKNKGVKLKSRLKEVDIKDRNPPPGTYNPQNTLTFRNRFSAVTFGFGDRYDFTDTKVKEFPSPGSYEIPSVFEFKKKPNSSTRQFKKKQHSFRQSLVS